MPKRESIINRCKDNLSQMKVCSDEIDDSDVSVAVDNFDIFADRVESLLARWKGFKERNPEYYSIANHCIRGFLSEVNDGFTSELLKEDTDAQDNSNRN